MYVFSSEDRLYENWNLTDANNKPFLSNIDPIKHRLLPDDIISDTGITLRSPYRISHKIPGILQLNNKTFGRHKNKLLYKCYPNDPRLPIFLIPYQDKQSSFNKSGTNKFVLFRFEEWTQKHPIGRLTQTFGSVDDYHAFCKYQPIAIWILLALAAGVLIGLSTGAWLALHRAATIRQLRKQRDRLLSATEKGGQNAAQ